MSAHGDSAAFACPRGHRHYEGSAFCTVCGAGPVLLDASGHPCPKGDDCALNNGAVHCFACRRNWPRDETWDVPFEERPIRERSGLL